MNCDPQLNLKSDSIFFAVKYNSRTSAANFPWIIENICQQSTAEQLFEVFQEILLLLFKNLQAGTNFDFLSCHAHPISIA